ncbi:MAG TPA: mechanosensitive ion channel protein, partial [Lachnospiraceae bacterium]|nr:mechanosensitive ion channel protein [Lachnospiraceae bacterium]
MIERFIKELPEKAWRLGSRVLLAAIVLFIGMQLIKVVRRFVKRSLVKGNADQGVIQFIDSFLKFSLYAVLVVTIASGFGMDAASILALLGSAGVAIGLAIQGSLS